MDNVLELKNVVKEYNSVKKISTKALKNINLKIKNNEFVGIMGSSGSGKTTLLNVASGIDKCNSGIIKIWKSNICQMKKNELSLFRRDNIGMVFQDFNLLNSLTIEENILTPLILKKEYELIETNVINELSEMLNISDIMHKYPYEISGGQKQRAAICRALINKPKIIFADEPTGNLDSKSSKKVLSYFDVLHRKYDVSLLMVTHDPFSAIYCDRVVFLNDGKIISEIINNGNRIEFYNEIIELIKDQNEIDFKQ